MTQTATRASCFLHVRSFVAADWLRSGMYIGGELDRSGHGLSALAHFLSVPAGAAGSHHRRVR